MSLIQSIGLVDKLVKAKIPKQTATELVDFVENNQSETLKDDIDELKSKADKAEDKLDNLEKKVDKLETKFDNLEKKVDKLEVKVEWLKWIMGIGFTVIFATMFYLHSDLKSDMKQLRADVKSDNQELRLGIEELKNLLQNQQRR